MPFTQPKAFRGTVETQLTTPGLYVFLCKLHPFMLGATIVDDPATPELDLGKTVTLSSGPTIPTASDLALRLVRAFFVITNTSNYQKYSATSDTTWDPTYPPVPVLAGDQNGNPVPVPNLDAFLGGYFHEPVTLPKATAPSVRGVGEVWVDTEFEKTSHKTKPGAATAVDPSTWKVTKKVALPELNFNNGHNMWAEPRPEPHLQHRVVRQPAGRVRAQDRQAGLRPEGGRRSGARDDADGHRSGAHHAQRRGRGHRGQPRGGRHRPADPAPAGRASRRRIRTLTG